MNDKGIAQTASQEVRRGGPFVVAQGKLYNGGTGSGSRAVRPVRRTGRDLVPAIAGTDGLLAPLPSQRTREKYATLPIDCQVAKSEVSP